MQQASLEWPAYKIWYGKPTICGKHALRGEPTICGKFLTLFNFPGDEHAARTQLTTKLRQRKNFIQVSFIMSMHFLFRASSTAFELNPTGIPVGSSWWDRIWVMSIKKLKKYHIWQAYLAYNMAQASSLVSIRPACRGQAWGMPCSSWDLHRYSPSHIAKLITS